MTVRLLRTTLFACLALLVLVAVVGCSSGQTEEANALMDEANAAIDQYNVLDAQLAGELSTIEGIDPASKQAAEALPLLDGAETTLDEMTELLDVVVVKTTEMTQLDVDDAIKTYAAQQAQIAELQSESLALTGELLTEFRVVFDTETLTQMSEEELTELEDRLNGLLARSTEIEDEISEKQALSEQFFNENLAD